MIKYIKGNIFDSDVEAIINTVNTVGVMGKGLALQFKKLFPDNYRAYKIACDNGEVVAGKMFIFDRGELEVPRYIINFPTKRHWRHSSRIIDIKSGLISLISIIKKLQINSIAIPPLGCSNGGLDWAVVRPLIEDAFSQLPEVEVHIYGRGK